MRFIILLFPLVLLSEILRVGDSLNQSEFADQNGTLQTLYGSQELLIAWDQETTALANQYFDSNATLIINKKISLLIDLSQAPKGILSLFVLPSIREYKHTVLLSYDERYSSILPHKEGYLTLLSLDDFKIANVVFINEKKSLVEHLSD